MILRTLWINYQLWNPDRLNKNLMKIFLINYPKKYLKHYVTCQLANMDKYFSSPLAKNNLKMLLKLSINFLYNMITYNKQG